MGDTQKPEPVAVEQGAELRALIAKATDSDLTDGGRYFADTCHDLTKCGHGDTGEYQDRDDGKLVEWLWNHRSTIADALAERARLTTDRSVGAVDADEFETVEAFEHDDQRELSLLYNHAAHDRPQFNRGQMRMAIRHGRSLAATPPVPATEASFLAAIHERTPTGQWIAVKHHPDGDWSVAEHPLPWLPGGEVAVPATSGEGEKLREISEDDLRASIRLTLDQPDMTQNLFGRMHGISRGHLSEFLAGKRGAEPAIAGPCGYRWALVEDTRSTDDLTAALATPDAAPIGKEWCLNMARIEGNAEIGAGSPDHPLRTDAVATDKPACWACGDTSPLPECPACGNPHADAAPIGSDDAGDDTLGDYPMAPMEGVEPLFVRQLMLQAMAAEYAKATGDSIEDMMSPARATWDTDWETDPAPRTVEAAVAAAQSDLECWEGE